MVRVLLGFLFIIIVSCGVIEQDVTTMKREDTYGTWALTERIFFGDTTKHPTVDYIMDISAEHITIYNNDSKINTATTYSYTWNNGTITYGTKSYKVERSTDQLKLTESGTGPESLMPTVEIYKAYTGSLPPEDWEESPAL